MELDYRNLNVLVLGLGVSGRASARFLLERGAMVRAVDKNCEVLQEDPEIRTLKSMGLSLEKENADLLLDEVSFAVASPGVARTCPIYTALKKKGVKVIGEVELAGQHLNRPLLAITGTNGKTTTALLVGHVLKSLGRRPAVLGNSGIPLIQGVLDRSIEIVVCELSSFQLETLNAKMIDSGAILNITEDHLDRYKSQEEYAKAKMRMLHCLKPNGSFFVGEAVWENFGKLFNGFLPKTIGFQPGCDVFCDKNSIIIKENIELILPNDYRGKSNHDVENIMAAFALCNEAGVDSKDFLSALETFQKPLHRVEFVRRISGVSFYNDSKGTNPDAVIRAVDAMAGKVVLIAGGQAKGTEFTRWKASFGEKVKTVLTIGEAAPSIESTLSLKYTLKRCNSLESAVKQAFSIAESGENVLLSPGCASFDMFKNYEHRGNCFKEIVKTLEERGLK